MPISSSHCPSLVVPVFGVILVVLAFLGPVARWMAVKVGAGDGVTDNVPPIEITAGGNSKACYESFHKVSPTQTMTQTSLFG